MWYWILLGLAIGVWTGFILGALARKPKIVGNLRIDESDPDGPYMFLELKCDPNIIKTTDYVNLKVVAENYISQK